MQEFAFEALTTATIVAVAFAPLYKPQPRRLLDTWLFAVRRTAIAVLALATIGYFDYTYKLPRLTLITAGAVLMATLPAYFVAIRRRPVDGEERTVIVGNAAERIPRISRAADANVVGYVAPQAVKDSEIGMIDGGHVTSVDIPRLGGLSRLEEVLLSHNADTAVLSFAGEDRSELFGALAVCHENGVEAQIHSDYADPVLTNEIDGEPLVDIDLEPWDPQDQVLKRLFDICFAGVGLVVLTPIIAVIAIAIKLEDGGPILYWQERTAVFGKTFTIAKFRSMVPNAESESGATISAEDAGGTDPRVTPVGTVLRTSHLDEIPQLWSVLLGDMSVVGPRPERPSLDADMESAVEEWPNRWFVRPGLTGLAQINGVTGTDPERKLQYDIEYIRQQSLSFDGKIVIRQLYQVLTDAISLLRSDAADTPDTGDDGTPNR
ncbi:sugar transferase [Halomicroarcula sp. GCM10025709]|uniref:sugar transferase n=1 Tax=Halomicroarcula sp. GCM10025709 TaxID=3252669 RepID=UPI003612674F